MKPHVVQETPTPRTFRSPDGREHESVRQNWFDAVHEAATALVCDPAEVREVMRVDAKVTQRIEDFVDPSRLVPPQSNGELKAGGFGTVDLTRKAKS